jgi:hypothetical protein
MLTVVCVVLGGAVGFAVGMLLYTWLNPVLEARRDWVRELQGFLFNVVLLLTVGGAFAGGVFARGLR